MSTPRYTSMPSRGYEFVAVPLKKNFNKRDSRVIENCTLYDQLKGPNLKSPAFIGNLTRFGILAATSGNTIDNFYQGGDVKLSHSVKGRANDRSESFYRTMWGDARWCKKYF